MWHRTRYMSLSHIVIKMNIQEVKGQDKKQIKTVLESLPDWFGLPDALEEYVKNSETLPVLGYVQDGTLCGFLTLKPTSTATLEVYVMGILATLHHQGIGRALLKEAQQYAQKEGYSYLQVKTLSPQVKDAHYLKTYAFYKAMGFQDVEVLPLWDEWNPCLMMIQKIEHHA